MSWPTICDALYEMLITLATICGSTTSSTNQRNGRAMIHGTMPVAGGSGSLGLPHLAAAFELFGELGAGAEAVVRDREPGSGRWFVRASCGRRGRTSWACGGLRRRWSASMRRRSTMPALRIERGLRTAAIEQFVEHQAERIDVGPLGDGGFGGVVGRIEGVEMFGGHVGDRAAEHLARLRRPTCCDEMLKSASIGRPYGLTRMLAGLMSRCSTPR